MTGLIEYTVAFHFSINIKKFKMKNMSAYKHKYKANLNREKEGPCWIIEESGL